MPTSAQEDVVQEDGVQAFGADGSNEPLRERVGPLCTDRRADDPVGHQKPGSPSDQPVSMRTS
jgi:hypothetical protein